MADTSVQHEVEAWVVREELPRLFEGRRFEKGKVSLAWGGRFEFDAVSTDGTIAVCISTSSRVTSSGKLAVGKIHKIKADTLYLLNAQGVKERVLLFTDPTMLEHFLKQREHGRFPSEAQVQLRHVLLGVELAAKLKIAGNAASGEVQPRRG